MTVPDTIIDLSDNSQNNQNNQNSQNDYYSTNEQISNLEIHMVDTSESSTYQENSQGPIIEYLPVLPCPTVTIQAPGAPFQSENCPGVKYSNDDITLKATPKDGIGPYYVVFRKEDATISPSRLGGLDNPITGAIEDVEITRVYTLNDLDVSSATLGTIKFSVYISDSCPTVAKTCESYCTVTLGCVAPVCNFNVT